MSNPTVTIAGAGPSGLTLAWWLVEHGVRVTVLEREGSIPRRHACLYLPPRHP